MSRLVRLVAAEVSEGGLSATMLVYILNRLHQRY
jgi:hypothetical protein